MILNAYSVQDVKSGVFCKPFFAPNDAVAIRDFAYAARDPANEIGRFPSDFCLFAIGSFNDCTGYFSPAESVIALGTASSLSSVE